MLLAHFIQKRRRRRLLLLFFSCSSHYRHIFIWGRLYLKQQTQFLCCCLCPLTFSLWTASIYNSYYNRTWLRITNCNIFNIFTFNNTHYLILSGS